jgi:ppGpp synthetase/RelA/SpoT-type nucleotidyltranferase
MSGAASSSSGVPSGLVQTGQSDTTAEAKLIDSQDQQMVKLRKPLLSPERDSAYATSASLLRPSANLSQTVSMSESSSSHSALPRAHAQAEDPKSALAANRTNSGGAGEHPCLQSVEAFIRRMGKAETMTNKDREVLEKMGRLLAQESEPDTETKAEIDIWREARMSFFTEYKSGFQVYQRLGTDVEDECERILKKTDIAHQKPSSRTKDLDSVEKKVNKEAPNLRKKGSSSDPKTQLYRRIVDLAGVRILVYFPDDVSQAVAAIEASGAFTILDAVVSFSRNRIDYRNKDKSDQLEGADAEYTKGPRMEKSVSTDEIIHRWKNSGYRAVHLHVQLKSQDPSPRLKNCWDDLEFPEDRVAEIQIMTVVMHAWSEIEHDVIYKNPHRIDINDTIARMLDGVNGLSINSEILLEELRPTVRQAEKNATDRDRVEFDIRSLAAFLESEYTNGNDDWVAHRQWVSALVMIASPGGFSLCCDSKSPQTFKPGLAVSTPNKLRNFVTKQSLLKMDPKQTKEQDISLAIMKNLATGFRRKCTKRRRDTRRLIGRNPNHTYKIFHGLYRWLIVANAFSIMVAMDGQAAIDEFVKLFPDSISSLSLINAVILGQIFYFDENRYRDLDTFAERFLEVGQYETHNFAVALASLWFYVDIPTKVHKTDNVPHSYREEHYGEFQPIYFNFLKTEQAVTCTTHKKKHPKVFVSLDAGIQTANYPIHALMLHESAHISGHSFTDSWRDGFWTFRDSGKDSGEMQSDLNIRLGRFDLHQINTVLQRIRI